MSATRQFVRATVLCLAITFLTTAGDLCAAQGIKVVRQHYNIWTRDTGGRTGIVATAAPGLAPLSSNAPVTVLAGTPDAAWLVGGAPLGDGRFEGVQVELFAHLPDADKANGAAVIICPGGGYGGKVLEGEGHGIARWLNQHGIAGFVLDYRLPRGNHHRPVSDAQRAIRYARANAAQIGINPKRIGIMGFSAGGHLASTVGTHFDAGNPAAVDLIERQSSRPDFMVLVYPVITMGEQTHGGSRKNLLGAAPTPELIALYSNEKQVTAQTPPAFITHARTDAVVPVAHSRMFHEALKGKGVAVEYLEFPEGNHGYNGYKGVEWDAWQKRCIAWLGEQGFLKAGK
jgi:acetyl esterase/lipase